MAVKLEANGKSLLVELNGGIIAGKQVIIRKSFSNIDNNATDEKMHNTASVLFNLQEKDLMRISKRETHTITQI